MRARLIPIPFVLLLGLLPWPAVWFALYRLHSAWAAFALYHGICLIGWLIARNPLPPAPKPVWLRRHWFGLGALCLLLNLAVYLTAGLFGVLLAPDRLRQALLGIHAGAGASAEIVLFVYFAFVNPVAEELFWRGTIYGNLRHARLPVAWCAVISGLLFGAWHWLPVGLLLGRPVAALAVGGITAAGIVFGLFYDRSRSLPATMLLHALGADVPILIAAWVDVVGKR